MLVVLDDRGVPSPARWVHVAVTAALLTGCDRGTPLVALAAAGLVACGSAPAPQAEPSPSSPTAAATSTRSRRGARGGSPASCGSTRRGTARSRSATRRRRGGPTRPTALAPLAEQPTATWFTNPGDPFVAVEQLSLAAAEAGQLPVLVAYYVPNRDCGSYSSGGATDVDAYLSWVGSFAAALGDRPAVVVLEPDAIAQARRRLRGRWTRPHASSWLTQAVADPRTGSRGPAIYLDAGNPELDHRPAGALGRAAHAAASRRPTASPSTCRTSRPPRTAPRSDSPSPSSWSGTVWPTSTSSSTPAATAPARRRTTATRTTGATRPAGAWARHRRRPPGSRASTRCCGSSSPVTPTAPAAVAPAGRAVVAAAALELAGG